MMWSKRRKKIARRLDVDAHRGWRFQRMMEHRIGELIARAMDEAILYGRPLQHDLRTELEVLLNG